MHDLGTADRVDAVARLAAEDEELANQFPARLLITAPTAQGVETLARRIHGAGSRAPLPFVQTWAIDLPAGPELLQEYCASLLDSAAGGSLLVSAIEEMPATAQDAMIDLLANLGSARVPSTARLISGTTVSLLDRVAAGTFSEQLFYRLNVIHLMVGTGTEAAVVKASWRCF